MTTHNRSLASLARQLQRAIPKSFEHQFDAEAFLNGTWVPPFELAEKLRSQSKAPHVQSSAHRRVPGAAHESEANIHLSESNPKLARPSRSVTSHGLSADAATSPLAELEAVVREIDEYVTTSDNMPTEHVVNTSEPESTTSNNLRDARKRCRALKKSGTPCNAYRLKGGDLCLFHEADALTNLDEARSRGGQHAPKRIPIDLDMLPVDFHDPASLLAFTEGLIRMQLAGLIPQRQCSQILRTLRIAERTLAVSAPAEGEAYIHFLRKFLDTAPVVAENLETRELHDRAREIEDVGAKRQEYLKANQQFGHNQPRPARFPSPASPHFRMPTFR
jgi:hypothetical protein